jgi:hypothetical protein
MLSGARFIAVDTTFATVEPSERFFRSNGSTVTDVVSSVWFSITPVRTGRLVFTAQSDETSAHFFPQMYRDNGRIGNLVRLRVASTSTAGGDSSSSGGDALATHTYAVTARLTYAVHVYGLARHRGTANFGVYLDSDD